MLPAGTGLTGRGTILQQAHQASRLLVLISFVVFSTFAIWLPSKTSAAPASGSVARVAGTHAPLLPVLKANVICARVKEGNKTRTWSCPDGNSCVNVAGSWKCRPNTPRPELRACSVCYNNQKRDANACTSSGNLPSQAACVNRVNSELMKCLGSCK